MIVTVTVTVLRINAYMYCEITPELLSRTLTDVSRLRGVLLEPTEVHPM